MAVLLHQYPISGWANRHSSPTLSHAAWTTFNHQYRTGHDNSHPTKRTMHHRDFIMIHPSLQSKSDFNDAHSPTDHSIGNFSNDATTAAWAPFNPQYRTGHNNSHPTRRTMQHRDFITVHSHKQLIQQLINHGEFPYTTRQRERDDAQHATRKPQYSNEHHLLQNVCPADKTDDLDALTQAGTPTVSLFTTVTAWRAEIAASAAPNQGP